jgi:nucleoid DNA-binding protein
MTKHDLAIKLAGDRRLNLSKEKALDIVETIFDLIGLELANGDHEFILRGFGRFSVRRLRAFTGRHPRTGEPLAVPQRNAIAFKPSADLLRRIN